jgi:hypothetical protein
VNEVGPELGFHQDEQRGVQDVERAAHRVRKIERRVKEPVHAADALLRHGVTGQRGRGKEEAVSGEALAQGRDERSRRQHLTHRNGVDPYRPVASIQVAAPSVRGRSGYFRSLPQNQKAR